MATIVQTTEVKEERKPIKAHEVKEAPKKEPKKASKIEKTITKLINGVEHTYCLGSFGWWPTTTFTQSVIYSDNFLESKGLLKKVVKAKAVKKAPKAKAKVKIVKETETKE